MSTIKNQILVGVQSTVMNFSFAGCGFLGIYHVGVASCLKRHAPHIIENCKFAGASAGAIVSCCLLCDCCLGNCTTFTLRLATKARSYSLGPLHPSFRITTILRDALREVLPNNAHEITSGRLFISLTRVSDRKNVIVSEYSSKEELIQALMCSAHVPLYCGIIPPCYRGVRYVDGGLSNNMPALNKETVFVSPFSGESDICPFDLSANTIHVLIANTSMQCNMENLYRMSRALFPPHPEILSDMCKQGFDDCLKYLQDNKLLSCVRHLSIRSVIRHVPKETSAKEYNTEEKQEKIIARNTNVLTVKQSSIWLSLNICLYLYDLVAFQEAIEEMNKGLKGYIYKYPSLRVLSMLTIPWFVPLDISCTFVVRFLQYIPYLPQDIQLLYMETVELLKYLVSSIRHQQYKYTAKFSCQLAVTEVNYNQIEKAVCQSRHHNAYPTSSYRNLNFEFAMDLDSEIAKMTNQQADLGQQIENVHLICNPRPRSGSASDCLIALPLNEPLFKDSNQTSEEIYDTFEHYLHISNQMESIMTYHYQDENNKDCYKCEEIYAIRDDDIDLSSVIEDIENSVSATRAQNLSLGSYIKQNHSELESDLETFVANRSDVMLKKHIH